MTLLACLAAVAGYYLWQRGRHEHGRIPSEAAGRAAADAAALGTVIAWIWIVGVFAARLGIVAAEGLPGATVGAVLGTLLADPVRRAVLRACRIDPRRVS